MTRLADGLDSCPSWRCSRQSCPESRIFFPVGLMNGAGRPNACSSRPTASAAGRAVGCQQSAMASGARMWASTTGSSATHSPSHRGCRDRSARSGPGPLWRLPASRPSGSRRGFSAKRLGAAGHEANRRRLAVTSRTGRPRPGSSVTGVADAQSAVSPWPSSSASEDREWPRRAVRVHAGRRSIRVLDSPRRPARRCAVAPALGQWRVRDGVSR